MDTIRALIIDDEANSRTSLRHKLNRYCPVVDIVAECESGEEGIDAIRKQLPELVFLDVEMPRMNGFTMLQQLHDHSFELIFVTAYDHYAVKAIRFSALDYLVKPVEADELKAAVERVMLRREKNAANARVELLLQHLAQQEEGPRKLAIPSVEGIQFVDIDDIIFVEAQSNYTVFHLGGGRKCTASKTLKEFEELLPARGFFRIHHSYIINIACVEKYLRGDGGQVMMKGGALLDVARRKKDEFLKVMGFG